MIAVISKLWESIALKYCKDKFRAGDLVYVVPKYTDKKKYGPRRIAVCISDPTSWDTHVGPTRGLMLYYPDTQQVFRTSFDSYVIDKLENLKEPTGDDVDM